MGMELIADLSELQQEDFDDPELSFLKRWQKQKLMKLAMGSMSHCLSGSETDLSGDETKSEGGDSESECPDKSDSEVVAMKHSGDPGDFQEHMRCFIEDFLGVDGNILIVGTKSSNNRR